VKDTIIATNEHPHVHHPKWQIGERSGGMVAEEGLEGVLHVWEGVVQLTEGLK